MLPTKGPDSYGYGVYGYGVQNELEDTEAIEKRIRRAAQV
jgi:hypothetical protein